MKPELTQQQVEDIADPGKTHVSLIYNVQGQVIGNSQSLARTCLQVSKVIDQLYQDIQAAYDKAEKALEV